MVEWVKDVDTGELFPVYNVREFDIPEHLKEAEKTDVDFDKTRENTILQLQEELTEAHERIKILKATPVSEKRGDEIVIAQKTYITSEDVNFKKVPKQHDLKKILFIVLAVVAVLLIGWFMVDVINAIPIETVEQAAEVAEEAEIVEFEDRLLFMLKKILPVFITVIGVRFAINFLMNTIRSV